MFDENAGSKQLSSRRSGRKFSTFAGRSHSRRPQDGDEISAVLYKFRNSLSMQEIGKGDSRNVSRTSESQNSNGKTAEAQHLPTPGFIFSTPNNNQKIKKRVFRRSKSYPGNKIYNGNMSQENSIPGNYFKKEDWLGKIRYWIDAEKPSRQRVHTLNRKQRNKSISKLYKIQYQGENARAETEKIPVISNHHHLAGNEAFRKKNYDRACAHYTQGINLFEKDVAGLSPQLAKLYSNRAAAYLALGRPIEASEDCERGIEHDSSYLKCWIRISTCYCCRGEFLKAREWLEKAQVQFQGNTTALNKISASHEEVASYEAKIHKILAYLGHNGDKKVSLSEEELHNALKDLEIVAKLFPNAEVVYWARAESLLRLMCLTEAQEVISTATNFVGATETYQAWKAWLLAQAYFFEGKINGTLVNLKALLEILITHSLRLEYKCMETPDKNEVQRLASALQKVEEARLRGKQAMKLQNYSFALEAYTTAIQVGVLSPVLASILYCNRAASHHGLSNYALALADCFMSRVLWLDNEKAYSRLATMFLELDMPDEAVKELEAGIGRTSISPAKKREFASRLCEIRSRRVDNAPKYCKLFGPQLIQSADALRKYYKKLALFLHPDKFASICRFSCSLGENGTSLIDHGALVRRNLQTEASRLFSLLNHAFNVLIEKY